MQASTKVILALGAAAVVGGGVYWYATKDRRQLGRDVRAVEHISELPPDEQTALLRRLASEEQARNQT